MTTSRQFGPTSSRTICRMRHWISVPIVTAHTLLWHTDSFERVISSEQICVALLRLQLGWSMPTNLPFRGVIVAAFYLCWTSLWSFPRQYFSCYAGQEIGGSNLVMFAADALYDILKGCGFGFAKKQWKMAIFGSSHFWIYNSYSASLKYSSKGHK